jgi:hypothetical protein
MGTTLGAIVGGATGLGIIAMTRGEPADGSMLPWGDLAAGAVLGSIPGMYLGARLPAKHPRSSESRLGLPIRWV